MRSIDVDFSDIELRLLVSMSDSRVVTTDQYVAYDTARQAMQQLRAVRARTATQQRTRSSTHAQQRSSAHAAARAHSNAAARKRRAFDEAGVSPTYRFSSKRQRTLADLSKKALTWHETVFGFEYTWVMRKNTYRVTRTGEVKAKVFHFRMDIMEPTCHQMVEHFSKLTGIPPYLDFEKPSYNSRDDYMKKVVSCDVIHTDVDCIEVSTPPSNDWTLHDALLKACNKFLIPRGFTQKRMRGVEQTQDMHVNVSHPSLHWSKYVLIKQTLNVIAMRYPVLLWVFAASYNDDTVKIPCNYNDYSVIRDKRGTGQLSYIEFRSPEMPKSTLEARAVGEFHRKLFSYVAGLSSAEQNELKVRLLLSNRPRNFNFKKMVKEFVFWCRLLDVDVRLFERMIYHNLWRRVTYYPENLV